MNEKLYKPLDQWEIDQIEIGRKNHKRLFYSVGFYYSRYDK